MKKLLIFIVVLTATSLIYGVAYSKANGTIFGQVTNESGNGIADVYVGVYSRYNTYWIDGSSTDSNGTYTVNVPAGIYKVYFSPSPSSGYYAPQWYNNKDNFQQAKSVTVTPFGTTFHVNAQLEIGGTISGRVTDGAGNYVTDVYVSAYTLDNKCMGGSSTDSEGNYIFNVPEGTYKISFSPSPSSGYYASRWYDNPETKDLVTVNASRTTSNINGQLEEAGRISGRVTDASGQTGVAAVYVSAFDPSYKWVTGSNTDSDGNYSFNIPAGTYKVQFNRPSINRSGYYVPEWYDNERKFKTADLITVTVLQTTSNIDAQLTYIGNRLKILWPASLQSPLSPLISRTPATRISLQIKSNFWHRFCII